MKRTGKETLSVCFFGIYDPLYSRNRVLISGFQENGYRVVHCRVDPRTNKGLIKFVALTREYFRVHEKFDLVIVAFPGHTVVWLARILFGKHIIFDAFVSLYNSVIEDRKQYRQGSLKAVYYWFVDWFSCVLAEKILLDTNAHIEYFVRTFRIPRSKFIRVLVGTTEDVFSVAKNKKHSDNFIIHFHGTLIPLQGLSYIINAARILKNNENILFRIIGGGEEYEHTKNLIKKFNIKNIELLKPVPLAEIAEYLHQADVSLGIFGDTSKTELVIPNKVYEAIACGVPIITANTQAARELFADKKNVFFCGKANAESIARAVYSLYKDKALRDLIGRGGYDTFKQHATPPHIVAGLLKIIT